MPKSFATAKQGLIAGLIGFATVAVLMFIVDLVAGRPPFYSAAALAPPSSPMRLIPITSP